MPFMGTVVIHMVAVIACVSLTSACLIIAAMKEDDLLMIRLTTETTQHAGTDHT